MKNLITLTKKNISDNKLSFLFLINRINYKKLKSIEKRTLLPHYPFFRFFLKAIETQFTLSWHQTFAQYDDSLQISLPGAFLEKRMFFKNINFTSILKRSNSDYVWYTPASLNAISKTTFFNKIKTHPRNTSYSVLSKKLILSFPDENVLTSVFIKNINIDLSSFKKFNTHMFYNVSFLNFFRNL